MSGVAKLRALKSILGGASVILAAGSAGAQSNAPAVPTPTAAAAGEPSAPAQPAPEPAQSPAATAPLEAEDLEVGTPAASGRSAGGLDEVVVTVDRRRKDLQKVSGTAQAFNERRLTSVGINGVAGLATMVPGLEIAQEEGNT
jgi:hypothetical protein